MRNARKKRKRHLRSIKVSELQDEIQIEEQVKVHQKQQNEVETQKIRYKCMAKTYWERWRYELDERKASLERERQYRFEIKHRTKLPSASQQIQTIPLIDRAIQPMYWYKPYRCVCCQRILWNRQTPVLQRN